MPHCWAESESSKICTERGIVTATTSVCCAVVTAATHPGLTVCFVTNPVVLIRGEIIRNSVTSAVPIFMHNILVGIVTGLLAVEPNSLNGKPVKHIAIVGDSQCEDTDWVTQ